MLYRPAEDEPIGPEETERIFEDALKGLECAVVVLRSIRKRAGDVQEAIMWVRKISELENLRRSIRAEYNDWRDAQDT
jgi:hypothetical protein